MEYVLSIANIVLTILFVVELVLKLFGMGWREFREDGFNIFDAIIVFFALIELSLDAIGHKNQYQPSERFWKADCVRRSFQSLRVLKSFRVLRLFKMFRYLSSLRKIGEVLISSASSFIAIVLLMFIFMIVFAIVGLHVYGGIFPNDVFPNFNSFLNSIIVMFNVKYVFWILEKKELHRF